MLDSRLLWKQRFVRYGSERRRYLRYMLNDHLLFVLLIGLGAGAFAYQRWLQTLTSSFPYAMIEAVVLSMFLTYGSVRTFFREADLVFLLPAEAKLTPYLRRAFVFSWGMQASLLSLAVLALAPLHLEFSALSIWLLWIILLALKGWNMWIGWKEQSFATTGARSFGYGTRLLFNMVFLYFLLKNVSILFWGMLLLIMAALSFYFIQTTKRKGLNWEHLILQEEKAQLSFYRLANIFTDVPHLKERAKRRKWMDFVLSFVPYRQEQAFRYLYLRTFLRAGDYLGLYIRLTCISCLVLYIVPPIYGKIIAALFFLYATGFQLLRLQQHHRSNIFYKLYPLSDQLKKKTVLQLLFWLLLGQNIVFALFMLVFGYVVHGLLLLFIGLVFSYWLLFFYFNRRRRVNR
ncbi:ABC transporter permease [Anoxybacteroides rupiense]|uniref:ABC transporter permease n=1 Tax=Anoxybacteroides rupiense TaxID=311460 RepID=UPI001F09749B|nr:ABC transporter permease [Anoxybacillus rupiensis]